MKHHQDKFQYMYILMSLVSKLLCILVFIYVILIRINFLKHF